MLVLMLFALIAGAGTAITPCVLPVVSALLSASAIGGRRAGRSGAANNTSRSRQQHQLGSLPSRCEREQEAARCSISACSRSLKTIS